MNYDQGKRDEHGWLHPMFAARLVRREKFAWPGGYPMALVTSDGGFLCPECVKENFHYISDSHRTNCNDGWKPEGVQVLDYLEEDEEVRCDHCYRSIK